MDIDAGGNLVFLGPSGMTRVGHQDQALIRRFGKYDSSGTRIWSDSIEIRRIAEHGLISATAGAIALDALGNTYLTGYANDTLLFDDATRAVHDSNAVFAAKYDPRGVLEWGSSWSYIGEGFSKILLRDSKGIAVDSDGTVAIGGEFAWKPSEGSRPPEGDSSKRGFLMRLDAEGQRLWTALTEFPVSGISLQGSWIYTGSGAYPSFDYGENDAPYFHKFTESGKIVWRKTIGRPAANKYGSGTCVKLEAAPDGSLFTVGTTDTTIFRDCCHASSYRDIFLAEVSLADPDPTPVRIRKSGAPRKTRWGRSLDRDLKGRKVSPRLSGRMPGPWVRSIQ